MNALGVLAYLFQSVTIAAAVHFHSPVNLFWCIGAGLGILHFAPLLWDRQRRLEGAGWVACGLALCVAQLAGPALFPGIN